MTSRLARFIVMTGIDVMTAYALAVPSAAQTAAPQPDPAAARKAKMPDGKPDASGICRNVGGGGEDGGAQLDEKGNLVVLNKSRGCHPGMKICTAPVNQSNDSTFVDRFDANRPIYKPEYWAKVQELDFNSNQVAPYFKCQ